MDNNNQLSRLENTRIIDIITKIPNLTNEDKHELSKRIASDDVEIRKGALEKITQSQIAQHDLMAIMGELSALQKQGMYVKSKQTIKTGSGSFEIEMKGGDTKLIIPVLIIVGIVIIGIRPVNPYFLKGVSFLNLPDEKTRHPSDAPTV